MTNMGAFMKALRVKNEESQMNMAQKLGVSCTYLSLIENGNRRFPSRIMKRFCHKYKFKKSEIEKIKNMFWKDLMEGEYFNENK